MSKEREAHHSDLQGGGPGLTVSASTSALRFRQHSPSNRRSRERNRRHNYSDQTRHLVYDISTDGMGSFEDSRLSGIVFDHKFHSLILNSSVVHF